jgi:hypothetical protein
MTKMSPTPEQIATDANTSLEQLTKLAKQSLKILKLIAKNPNADPELLRKLASGAYEKIRESVAGNPNTPTDVILDLGANFPKQMLNNPVFPLLMLENSNLAKEMPWQTRNKLYGYKTCPEPLRSQIKAMDDIPF